MSKMNNTSVKNRILQFQTQSRGDISSNSSNNNKSHKNHSCGPTDSLSTTTSTSSSISSFISSIGSHSHNSNSDSSIHSNESNGFQFNSISSNSFLTNNNINKVRAFGTMNTNPKNQVAQPPTLQAKKASMTINLSSNGATAFNDSSAATSKINPPRAKPRTPTKNPSFSAIPKPSGPSAANCSVRSPILNSPSRTTEHNNSYNNTQPQNLRVQRTHTSPNIIRSTGSSANYSSNNNAPLKKSCLSPATTPTSNVGFGSSTGRFYGSINWKDKYEESEKKRLHVVTLAQKATRDYEELRRRYQDLYSEHEKLLHKFDGAASQLDSLRKASEAAYDEYYKLKKKYEVENNAKSEALNRVDQYNKENRRLKRASALMMQQISDPTSFSDGIIDEVSEADNPDNDKEIQYLRNRVQELETRIVDLESELEKIKLAEFETQESVMVMNDAVQSSKSESSRLKEQLKKLDEENRRLQISLDDTIVELESLKGKCNVDDEKLIVAETELKKLLNEKNILQRQSMVFLNDEMDNRLLDALNQIGDLQTALEEQKNSSEAQVVELRNQLQEKEYHEEIMTMQTNEKIKSLEEEIQKLHKRAEEAEKKLDEMPFEAPTPLPPPPPPPPMPNFITGPPLPPPMPSSTSLNSSLNNTMRTLKRVNTNGSNSDATSASSTPPNGVEGQPKSLVGLSPHIDDVISQLKKGQIKLRPMDRTLSRKETEIKDKQQESTAVDDLRSILNNLKRTQRLHN